LRRIGASCRGGSRRCGWIRPFDSNPGLLAGGSRSGFRPTGILEGATGLPVGLHNLCRREKGSPWFQLNLRIWKSSHSFPARAIDKLPPATPVRDRSRGFHALSRSRLPFSRYRQSRWRGECSEFPEGKRPRPRRAHPSQPLDRSNEGSMCNRCGTPFAD